VTDCEVIPVDRTTESDYVIDLEDENEQEKNAYELSSHFTAVESITERPQTSYPSKLNEHAIYQNVLNLIKKNKKGGNHTAYGEPHYREEIEDVFLPLEHGPLDFLSKRKFVFLPYFHQHNLVETSFWKVLK